MKYIKQRDEIYKDYVKRGVPELLAASFAREIDDEDALYGVMSHLGFYEDVEEMLFFRGFAKGIIPSDFWQQFTFENRATKL
jgi:hypothetical protein